MGLTPEHIEGREFAPALRGYDRRDVRSFLVSAAATVAGLQEECARLREAVVDAAHGPGAAGAVAGKGSGAAVDPATTRVHIAQLLEQARAQGETIRREAEGPARVRVRAALEQAERRLSVLHTAEQASRARLQAVQQELADALRRLDDPTGPCFDGDEPGRDPSRASVAVAPPVPPAPPAPVRAALPVLVPAPSIAAPPAPPAPAASRAAPLPAPAPPASRAAPPRAPAPPPAPPAPPPAPRPAPLPAPAAAAPGASPAQVEPGPRRVPSSGGDGALAALVRHAVRRAVESARPGPDAEAAPPGELAAGGPVGKTSGDRRNT